ncbi:hypothetical protein XENTR_v10020923 [Xenopus tropicalis]|nr:hypothetical protein XENTR_v10020923 [Xenopus tropicalis]
MYLCGGGGCACVCLCACRKDHFRLAAGTRSRSIYRRSEGASCLCHGEQISH